MSFFCGRIVSYTIYVIGATAIEETLGATILDSLTSPLGIALQVLMLGALVALVRVDWLDVLRGSGSPREQGVADLRLPGSPQ